METQHSGARNFAFRRLLPGSALFCFLFISLLSSGQKPLPTNPANMAMEDMKRMSKMTPQQSRRSLNLECPSWLKIKFSLMVAKLQADCNAFNIEADVYKTIQVGAKKEFKTGTSTLYAGAGIEGKFKGVARGKIEQQFYVVFDHNNEFADLGMRGTASGDLASGAIGAEFGYDFAMNSGFNAQGSVKSDWIANYEKALNYVVK